MLRIFLLVGLGSAAGGGTRLIFQEIALGLSSDVFSFLFIATVLVNALAGGLLGWVHAKTRTPRFNAILGTGFCGGFSTFSLYSLDIYKLSFLSGAGYAAI